MDRRALIALAAGLTLTAAAGLGGYALHVAASAPEEGGGDVGGPFRMTDHTGRTVTEADFRGRPMLVYFGYTYCPDVCPTELSTMIAALKALGPQGAAVRPVFVSVDPARDTSAHLADYVALFSPDLTGLTGTDEQVKAMASAYRVYYAKAPGSAPDAYLMNHSAFVYLMGADGRFRAVLRGGEGPDAMASALKAALAKG
jgi:cytochrome oxidase Cu insertion factor (SCO1/SenC/PrrC family)